MIWYHVYFIVVTMFGIRGQWALYPPRALYPTLPYFLFEIVYLACCSQADRSSCFMGKLPIQNIKERKTKHILILAGEPVGGWY